MYLKVLYKYSELIINTDDIETIKSTRGFRLGKKKIVHDLKGKSFLWYKFKKKPIPRKISSAESTWYAPEVEWTMKSGKTHKIVLKSNADVDIMVTALRGKHLEFNHEFVKPL